jgi:hypothetical protein
MSKGTYLLKLLTSVKTAAARLAKAEGVSLNQFIAAAVAEKVGVMETAREFFERRAGDAACTSARTPLGHSRSTSKRWQRPHSVGSPNAASVTDRSVSAIVRGVHQSASTLRPSSARYRILHRSRDTASPGTSAARRSG